MGNYNILSLKERVAIEVEFCSPLSPYVLTEYIASKCSTQVDHTQSYTFRTVSERTTWGRMQGRGKDIGELSTGKEWMHKICSPVIDSPYGINEILKVLKHLGGAYDNKPVILGNIRFNFIYVDHNKSSQSSTSVKEIEIQTLLTDTLSVAYSSLKSVRITPEGTIFQSITLHSITEVKNTLFVLDEVMYHIRTVTLTENYMYNLEMLIKTPTLVTFINERMQGSTVKTKTEITATPLVKMYELNFKLNK